MYTKRYLRNFWYNSQLRFCTAKVRNNISTEFILSSQISFNKLFKNKSSEENKVPFFLFWNHIVLCKCVSVALITIGTSRAETIAIKMTHVLLFCCIMVLIGTL